MANDTTGHVAWARAVPGEPPPPATGDRYEEHLIPDHWGGPSRDLYESGWYSYNGSEAYPFEDRPCHLCGQPSPSRYHLAEDHIGPV